LPDIAFTPPLWLRSLKSNLGCVTVNSKISDTDYRQLHGLCWWHMNNHNGQPPAGFACKGRQLIGQGRSRVGVLVSVFKIVLWIPCLHPVRFGQIVTDTDGLGVDNFFPRFSDAILVVTCHLGSLKTDYSI
jgi:hypothetical protein